jgi:hypothetical protein
MSKVQICNRALSTYLGVGRINSLTESTAQAQQCDMHFDDTLAGLLETHWWVFATGRQVLAEVTNDRATEWAYKYAMPADAIDVRWVNEPTTARARMAAFQSPDTDREMIEGFIYSDVQSAVCEYTKIVSDTGLFPQYFSDALSAALAANVAMALTEDIKRARNAMEAAAARLDAAIARDERQGGPREYGQIPDWLATRGVS